MADITELQVTGTPGVVRTFVGKTEVGTSPRPALDPQTDLGVMGLPSVPQTLEAKTEENTFSWNLTDTLSLTFDEDAVDQQEIEGWDFPLLSLSEVDSKTTTTEVPPSDSLLVALTEVSVVAKSSTTDKAGTDTLSLSVTESGTVKESILGTDPVSLSITEVSELVQAGETIDTTDTLSVSLIEDYQLITVNPQDVPGSDTLSLAMSSVSVLVTEDLYRQIDINLEWPEWNISLRLR